MLPGITSDLALASTSVSGGGGGSYVGGSLDTQTITVGASGSALNGDRIRGFVIASLGSISDGTSNLYSGAVIRQLAAFEDGAGGYDVTFQVTGVVANSGWSSMNIGGSFILNRASAVFSTSGGNTSWTWPDVGNPFGAAGSLKIVGFD